MIIGIDGNEANVENKVGIGQYAFELLNHFQSDKKNKFRIYLKNKPLPHMPKESANWEYRIVGPKKLWTQIGLPLNLFLDRKRPDVFFSPTHYAPRFSPIPTAISIMDLSYELFPDLFSKDDLYQLKNWTAYSAKNASKIFTISESSKGDIIKIYKVSKEKVVVTYPGIKKLSNMESDKFNKKGDYILFVGTLQPRKNIVALVEAFSNLSKKYSNLKLLIVGKKGWQFDEILESPKKFEVEEKVEFMDFVTDSELPSLYKNAKVFVLPSLYEGFGLPVLEAMQYGAPVVTSNVSSLPEAGGDAALYFDPENVGDIEEKIEKVLKDDKLREEMIKKGYEQVKKFSWDKAAKETLKELEAFSKNG